MNLEQARAVVLVLQSRPLYYRNFGVWWWHVKRELKRLGFTRDNLAHLGDFEDTACVEHYYAGLSPAELTAEAFAYQASAAQSQDGNPRATAPDGEVYLLLDEDAE